MTLFRKGQKELLYACRFSKFNLSHYRSCDLRWFLSEFPNLTYITLDLDLLVEEQRTKFLGGQWITKIVDNWPRLRSFTLLVPGSLPKYTDISQLGKLHCLEELHLECTIHSPKSFNLLLRDCVKLKRLTFHNRGRTPGRLLAGAFEGLNDNLRSVSFITRSWSSIDSYLQRMAISNPSLEELCMPNAYVTVNSLIFICDKFSRLKLLEFGDMNQLGRNYEISDIRVEDNYVPEGPLPRYIPLAELHQINRFGQQENRENHRKIRDIPFDKLINLQTLICYFDLKVTDAMTIINRCARSQTLEKIHLELNNKISAQQSNMLLSNLCASCPKLNSINLMGLASLDFMTVLPELSRLEKLRQLNLKFRNKIYSDNFVSAWTTYHDEFAKRLTSLTLISNGPRDELALSCMAQLHFKAKLYRRIIKLRFFTCDEGTRFYDIGDCKNDDTNYLDRLLEPSVSG